VNIRGRITISAPRRRPNGTTHHDAATCRATARAEPGANSRDPDTAPRVPATRYTDTDRRYPENRATSSQESKRIVTSIAPHVRCTIRFRTTSSAPKASSALIASSSDSRLSPLIPVLTHAHQPRSHIRYPAHVGRASSDYRSDVPIIAAQWKKRRRQQNWTSPLRAMCLVLVC
jgi:hypothetical protein